MVNEVKDEAMASEQKTKNLINIVEKCKLLFYSYNIVIVIKCQPNQKKMI
jgi:hypothetical protein